MSVPWGHTIWTLHNVNHGGAFRVQYSLSPATKGGRGGLKVAAATLVDVKIEWFGFASHEAQVAHVRLGPISLLPPKKKPLGNTLSKVPFVNRRYEWDNHGTVNFITSCCVCA